jgi:hypothetical protein
MSVTINAVRDSIFTKLYELYPNKERFGEEIKEGLDQCFFVKLLHGSQNPGVSRRAMRMHPFDIHYFGTSNEEMNDVADALFSGLKTISVNGSICNGTGMNYEIFDRVLHFFVDYNFRVAEEIEPGPAMERMTQEVDIR